MIKLKPCPFCGGEAEFERAGTARMSTIVSCTECGATLESGEVGEMAGTSWNSRETDEQLAKANERCAKLNRDAKNNELVHVGYTNGHQIKYAKVEEGAFYPDTSGDCYIPLYMLKSHEHRIETTSIEQLRKEQEK